MLWSEIGEWQQLSSKNHSKKLYVPLKMINALYFTSCKWSNVSCSSVKPVVSHWCLYYQLLLGRLRKSSEIQTCECRKSWLSVTKCGWGKRSKVVITALLVNQFIADRVISCQITRRSHGWHLRFHWNLDHRMRSWRKYYPENFRFIPHMVQKLLLFEFCPKLAKIAFCQMQARFSQLGVKLLTNEKSNQTGIWTTCSLPPK